MADKKLHLTREQILALAQRGEQFDTTVFVGRFRNEKSVKSSQKAVIGQIRNSKRAVGATYAVDFQQSDGKLWYQVSLGPAKDGGDGIIVRFFASPDVQAET